MGKYDDLLSNPWMRNDDSDEVSGKSLEEMAVHLRSYATGANAKLAQLNDDESKFEPSVLDSDIYVNALTRDTTIVPPAGEDTYGGSFISMPVPDDDFVSGPIFPPVIDYGPHDGPIFPPTPDYGPHDGPIFPPIPDSDPVPGESDVHESPVVYAPAPALGLAAVAKLPENRPYISFYTLVPTQEFDQSTPSISMLTPMADDNGDLSLGKFKVPRDASWGQFRVPPLDMPQLDFAKDVDGDYVTMVVDGRECAVAMFTASPDYVLQDVEDGRVYSAQGVWFNQLQVADTEVVSTLCDCYDNKKSCEKPFYVEVNPHEEKLYDSARYNDFLRPVNHLSASEFRDSTAIYQSGRDFSFDDIDFSGLNPKDVNIKETSADDVFSKEKPLSDTTGLANNADSITIDIPKEKPATPSLDVVDELKSFMDNNDSLSVDDDTKVHNDKDYDSF